MAPMNDCGLALRIPGALAGSGDYQA